MLQNIQKFLETSKLRYLIAGVLIFVFTIASSSWYYNSTSELLITYTIRTGLQIILAVVIIELLIPTFLDRRRMKAFCIAVAGTLLVFYCVCILLHMYFFETKFPDTYANYIKRFRDTSFWGRFTNISQFISKSLYLLYPTFLLLVLKLYLENQRLIKLNEQKKIAELSALKHQLNPHFLFNTLNNLHTLTLKKSNDSSIVIEKLSHILDYTLYRCNEDYVTVEDEIKLINNYLSLEKIRYGDRVTIDFIQKVNGSEKIAPLLLLTFIENAFKHGVVQEIDMAKISILIENKEEQLVFSIKNSVPISQKKENKTSSIGLKNIKEQLELLYPKAHELLIYQELNSFTADLKLKTL